MLINLHETVIENDGITKFKLVLYYINNCENASIIF